MFVKFSKLKIVLIGAVFLFAPMVVAAISVGDIQTFNLERNYDAFGRTETKAVLQKITNQLYFYVEEDWWNEIQRNEQLSLDEKMYNLSVEFERNIYPELTSAFGQEAEFGADGDKRITVLVHRMTSDIGGYFGSGDIYEKIQYPKSNQRKMVYLNSQYIGEPNAKSFLAHEFMHLITVNQKNLKRNVNEEIWLNEARSEYAPTLLGYNDIYQNSYLEARVNSFLNKPSVSLTEWLNRKEDYGVVNLFTHYLVDHYGIKVLADSLKSDKIGIESINHALTKNNFKENFEQIFNDWLITALVNDCDLGEKYCYLNKNLENLRIVPDFYYLQKTGAVFSVSRNTTHWTGNWYRFIGGSEIFSLKFKGTDLVNFQIPYLVCDLKDNCSVNFIVLNKEKSGEINISDFNEKYGSLTIMPFIKSKTVGFNGQEGSFSFSWQVSTYDKSKEEEKNEEMNRLLNQINELKKQINQYQTKINAILGVQGEQISCSNFNNNLYFGIRNNSEVRCLQQFLKNQGSEIYPEGLVTGNFLSLTKTAVIRFQEKYKEDILAPWNLISGTGFVGSTTRAKINQLLNF